MDLSVVVPTLNGRDQLAACLDALAAHADDAEIIVVNGPSADGTTGMVRDRDDVDVLVEISDRTVNVARNAGIEVSTGETIAIVDYTYHIGPSWRSGLETGLEAGAVVTGPIRDVASEPVDREGRSETGRAVLAGTESDRYQVTRTVMAANAKQPESPEMKTAESSEDGLAESLDERVAGSSDGGTAKTEADEGPERRRIARRDVTYFAGGNVAFRRSVLRDIDGFDEYLHTGGARDAAHRLAALDHDVVWVPTFSATESTPPEPPANGDSSARDWGWKYRALAYRLLKNYGVRPGVMIRTGSHAVQDATSIARDVIRGDATPSSWAGNGRDVLVGIARGSADGMVARARDRTPARNPNGISKRADRAVAKYDSR